MGKHCDQKYDSLKFCFEYLNKINACSSDRLNEVLKAVEGKKFIRPPTKLAEVEDRFIAYTAVALTKLLEERVGQMALKKYNHQLASDASQETSESLYEKQLKRQKVQLNVFRSNQALTAKSAVLQMATPRAIFSAVSILTCLVYDETSAELARKFFFFQGYKGDKELVDSVRKKYVIAHRDIVHPWWDKQWGDDAPSVPVSNAFPVSFEESMMV